MNKQVLLCGLYEVVKMTNSDMMERTAQWDILECATHYKRCICSNCKTPALRKSSAYVPSKYCPNCGCRMIAEAHYKDDTEFEEMYGKV